MLTFLFPPDDKDTSFQSLMYEIEFFFNKIKLCKKEYQSYTAF